MRVSRLFTHTLQFVKAYYLHAYETVPAEDETPMVITQSLVTNVMRTLTTRENGRRGRPAGGPAQEQLQLLTTFYEDHYRRTIPNDEAPISSLNLTQIQEYLSKEVVTAFDNNIKANFLRYLQRFVNSAHAQHTTDAIKAINEDADFTEDQKKAGRTQVYTNLKNVATDIMMLRSNRVGADPPDKQSPDIFHAFIELHGERILPNRQTHTKGYCYDIAVSPMDYLYGMVYMTDYIETAAALLNDEKTKLMNVFPLSSSMAPRHFPLDSTSLISILDDSKEPLSKRPGGTLHERKKLLWQKHFHTNLKAFRVNQVMPNGYTFDHAIKTDGISITLQLKQKSLLDERINATRAKIEKPGTKYLADLNANEKVLLQGKTTVAIDPNMRDILFCVDTSVKEEQQQWRFTMDTRRKEMNVKKNRQILERRKRTTIVEGKSIIEWEASGLTHNKKTMTFEKFMEYLKWKNMFNLKISPFYAAPYFRKLKLTQFMRNQRCNSKLLKEFKAKYHPNTAPSNVVVAFGDWEQRLFKYHEPTKGKGMRVIFEKAGYHVYLVNEFHTSKKCSKCKSNNAVVETFRKVRNPRPWRRAKGKITCHGLVRCTTCKTLWNRDVNSACNIHNIASATIAGNLRPGYLTRVA